uniref:Uncharacterized protein n=1 Tax=Auxenochlorella protothecoides TaxID=3075 RepID=A0A1D2A5N2_AUXPR
MLATSNSMSGVGTRPVLGLPHVPFAHRAGTAGVKPLRHALRRSRRSPVVTASLVDPSALYSLSTSAADAGGSSMLALLAGSALVAGLLYHTYQVKAHRQTSLASVGGVASPFGSSFNSVRQEATRLPSAAVAGAMAAPSAAPAAPIELSPLEEQEEVRLGAPDTRPPAAEWIAAWRAALEASAPQLSNGKAAPGVSVLKHATEAEKTSLPVAAPVASTAKVAPDSSEPQAAHPTVALAETVPETPAALAAAAPTPAPTPPQAAPLVPPPQAEASGPAYQTRLAEIQASSLGDVKRRVVSIGEAYQSKVGELWSSYAKRQAVASPVIAESAGSPRAPVEETITLDVLPKAQRGGAQLAPAVQRWVADALHKLGLRFRALLDRLAALQAGLTHDAAGRELGFLQALKAALRQLLKGPPPSKGEQRQALGA